MRSGGPIPVQLSGSTSRNAENSLGGSPGRHLPALTLIEVLVSLAILSLMLSLVTTSIGPWMQRGRGLEREARFWRQAQDAQLLVGELSASAIDLSNTLHRSDDSIRFQALVPRLSAQPIDVTISVRPAVPGRTRPSLMVDAGNVHPMSAEVIGSDEPLRLREPQDDLMSPVVVEARIGQRWTPVVVAPFDATGPLNCSFDLISQACR